MANLPHHPYLHEVKAALQADAIAAQSEKKVTDVVQEVRGPDEPDDFEVAKQRKVRNSVTRQKLISDKPPKPADKGRYCC